MRLSEKNIVEIVKIYTVCQIRMLRRIHNVEVTRKIEEKKAQNEPCTLSIVGYEMETTRNSTRDMTASHA